MSFKHLNASPLSPDKAIVVLAVIVGSQGVQTKNVIDVGGGMNVGSIDNGDWMIYPVVTNPSAGGSKVEYRVARGFSDSGTMQLETAGRGTAVYKRISIGPSAQFLH